MARRLFRPFAAAAGCCYAVAASAGTAASAGGDVAVVAYLPEWRYEGANWETIAEHATHLLLFSTEISPSGEITAMDRIPRRQLLQEARAAATRHGTRLMLCFGGNGRSNGFSGMSREKKARRRFVKSLVKLLDELDLDGVDYNWEYPGYRFGSGYMPEAEVDADYQGLAALINDTQRLFAKGNRSRVVTMAYYPDSRQEQLLRQYDIDKMVDLMHMMSYDQGGTHHSTLEFGLKSADQGSKILPPERLTMGVPFYGRDSRKGDWTTYEDLVQRHDPLSPDKDAVPVPENGAHIGFNGVKTIEAKTRYALEKGLGGVMIWEVGQDCRLVPVTHGHQTHVRTCPTDDASLLLAITRAIHGSGRTRERMPGWRGMGAGTLGKDEL